jgi:flagellar hook-associated protein 3 FlgL
MRIANNTLSENIVLQLQRLTSQQAKLQTQVATGQRIFQPEDDPTAVGRVLGLESEQREIAQFTSNATRALEVSEASFAGLKQVKKVSDRATEIGTLGTGAISAESARAYASEVDQLIEQTLQVANTKFRNDYLFAGTAVDTEPYTVTRNPAGQATAVAYAGNAQRTAIPLSENASISPGTTGATNTGLRDFINDLVALRDALAANDGAAVQTAQEGLVEGEDLLVSALAEHGGVQMRIDANRLQLFDRADNIEGLVSAEADVDMPTTIVRLNQSQTAYQAALSSSANIMRISLLDYIK